MGLQQEDRNVTIFLWIEDLKKSLSTDNFIIFQFTKILFGIISSQFLLAGTVHLHLSRVGTENPKKACDGLYVDNLVTDVANLPNY